MKIAIVGAGISGLVVAHLLHSRHEITVCTERTVGAAAAGHGRGHSSAPQASQVSGSFWLDRARRPTHLLRWRSESDEDRARLWAEVERLSGQRSAH
jgi:glycine/D-amino acid oxidase-like deaminating enzyme